MTKPYILYGTLGCHLCEEAQAIIIEEAGISEESLLYVDIAEDISLCNQYEIKIPVLLHATTRKELLWPFSVDDVVVFKNRCNANSQ